MPTPHRATLNHPVALDRVVRFCALALLLVGLMVFAGWALKIEALKSVLPGLTSMKPNTALGFVLAGIALAQRQHSGLRLGCAAAMLVLGGLSLAQDLTGADFGTDQLLFRDSPGAAQTVHPGRMSPITAVSFILLGGALGLLGTRQVARRRTLEALALFALSLALLALIGYAYDTQAVFPLPGFGSMALLTPPALALLALGILCARADGLAGVLASASLGGQVARRFLPLALIAPVLLGGLVQMGEGAGLFDITQGTAVFAAAMVLVLVALSWRNARSLEASDAERQRAEQKLREREALLSILTEHARVGMLMVTAEHRYAFANAAAAELLGLPSADIVGQRLADVMAPVYESQIRPRLDKAFAGERVAYELTLPPRAPGEGQRFLSVAYDPPVATVLGRCLIVVLVDITERKQAEDALRESEEFSRSIIKSSPDCIKVLDLEGNLLSMQSGQELLGIEDIRPFLNKSWLDFWTGKDRPVAQAAVESAAAGGAGNFVGFFCTLRGEAKWWDVAISPILDAHGKPARLLAVSRDVTPRQQADAVLHQRSAQFETLVNEAPLGIYLIDADFRVRQVNPTALPSFGNIPGLIGRDFAEVMHILWPEAQADVVVERFRHTLETGAACFVPEMIETRADRQATEYYEWQINRIPLPDGSHGVVCYFRDISERVLAQLKIRESEARYRSLFNSIDEGFCVIDMVFDAHDKAIDYRFLEVNPAFEKQTGLHGATGKRMRELNPDLEAHWFEIYGKVALTGESLRFTNEAKPMDGRWFDVYAFRLDGPPSSKVALLFSDITERKRRERNLGFLADLQKVLTPLTSAAHSMRVASQRIAELLELNHCVLMEIDEAAQTATVLHDHHAAGVASLVGDYRIADFLGEAERQALAAGKTLVIADVRSDGRTTQKIEHFAALGARAMVETPYVVDGRLRFMVAAMRAEPHAWAPEDVELLTELAARLCVRIERARAEQRLVESEERMRRAAEAARFGVYDRDLRGAYFHTSAQINQMLGYAPDAPLGHRQVMSHIHPDDRAAGVAAFQRGCDPAGDGRIKIEQRIVRRDGVVRWIATVGQVLFKDGAPERSLGFWVDITERKEAEAVLRRRDEELRAAADVALASKYKSEFLANMSHELRTPLNSLLILSRLLADNTDKNLSPKQVEFAETMFHAGSDLLRLINEVLDLSRIEAGQVEVYVEAVALAKLRDRIERDFRHVAQARHLDFSVSLDPQLPAIIRSDANRLEQVLKNLLANSFKFTERGSVKLAIRRAADGWGRPHTGLDGAEGVIAFAVTDSGIGVAPDQQQLIFDAFAQADGTTSRKYGGTGLGLSISRELASLLGGAITLTSQPGAGSTFTLYLPFTYTAPSAPPHPTAELTGRQPMAQIPPMAVHSAVDDDREAITSGDDVLLIVEYDPVFARLLLDIAHRHAFKGLVASTAATALQLARTYQPVAITLSVTLPDLDGWTLLQHVNDDLGLRHIPVHIVSGEDERPRGLRQGAASCLQKPASEAALGALFERIRAAKARPCSLLLVVEDDLAMQRQIVLAVGESADVRITLVASAEAGLAELKARRYDCVVLDLRLPGMSGYEFLEAVRDELRIDDLPIVVYTGMELSTQQQARLRQLAESVLVKDARSLDRLLDQTSLYLHRRVRAMPDAARATLERLHGGTEVFAGTKVLVVDDDMRNVFAMVALLENAGIEAKHAESAVHCLELLEATGDFDAVLMDIMMPGMDGYAAMRRIRKMKGFEGLPVIALTAKAMKGDRERCIEAGATDYLTKPVDPERLLALLRYWIGP